MNNNSNSNKPGSTFFDQLKELRKDYGGGGKSQSRSKKQPQRPSPFENLESMDRRKSFSERLKKLEESKQKEKPKKKRFERKEFTVFAYAEHKEKKEIEEEIRKVRQELLLVIKEMKKLGSQVEQAERAVFAEVVDPGVYHLNFFQKLLAILKVLRKNIQDSKNWLSMVFDKKRKRRYWNMAKKKGSKYTMSHERRMATQVG